MSINIPAVLQDARHKLHDGQTWLWLLGIQIPTTPNATRYRFANHTTAVTFDTTSGAVPLVWSPWSFKVGEWQWSGKGDLSSVLVTASNVTRELGLAIEQHNGLIGQECELRYVYSGALGNPAAQVKFEGRIMSTRCDIEAATITVGSRDIQRIQTPQNRFSKHRCGNHVQFGGPLCGYVIPASPGESVGTGFSTCSKSLAACDERGDDEVARSLARKHPERWGGFAGLPRV